MERVHECSGLSNIESEISEKMRTTVTITLTQMTLNSRRMSLILFARIDLAVKLLLQFALDSFSFSLIFLETTMTTIDACK